MSRTQHLLRSSLLVLFIYSLSKLTGFVKLLLMTRFFGTGSAADAFAAASQLPELFYSMVVGGALAAALIPVYSAYLTESAADNARQLAHSVLTLAMLTLSLICGTAALFAPWITQVFLVPDFSPDQQQLTASLMRIVLIATTLIGVGSVLSSLLHAHQHFLAPALATVVVDLGHIAGLYFLAPTWGIYGVAWGSVMGALLFTAIQIPAYVRQRIGYRLALWLHLEGTREVLRLMGPRIVTLGVVQAVDLIFIRLASPLAEGSIAAYFYAMLAMVAMPKGLFGSAISTVLFPTLSEQYNAGERRNLAQTVTQGLRATWALVIPAAVGLLALGRPAVTFLFERGAFGAESTALVYTLMLILAVRLLSEASQDILYLPFFAHHNTLFPMWASLGWMIGNISLSYLLVGWWGIHGLAWAASSSALLLALTLYLWQRQTMEGFNEKLLLITLKRTIIASLVMFLMIRGVQQLELATLPYLAVAISLGMITYGVSYTLLGGREMVTIWRLARENIS